MTAGRFGSMWSLPGPAAFVRRACDELYATRALALTAPGRAVGLARALEGQLAKDGQLTVVPVALGPEDATVAAIGAALDMPGASPAALATATDLGDAVAVVSCDRAVRADDALSALMRMTAAAQRAPSLTVALVGESFAGLSRTREARAIVDPLDAAAYVAGLPLDHDVFHRRLVASVSVEVAAWDIDLLERLAALPVDKAVRPDAHVPDWLDERHDRWRGRSRTWDEGSLDAWGEEACPHPLWVAANHPDGLRERVWRGQVGVLLPWLEARRREVIDAYRRSLRPDPAYGPDVRDLEWGALCHQLDSTRDVPPVQAMRYLRNELAHGQPVHWPRIRRTRDEWRTWSSRGAARSTGRTHGREPGHG